MRTESPKQKREREKRERIKRLSLNGERRFTEEIAQHLTSGQPDRLELAGLMLGASSQRLRDVADALEGKAGATPTCLNIVAAWHEAWLCAARGHSGGMNVSALPTVHEVKREFVRLFVPEKQLPPDWCSRKGLSRPTKEQREQQREKTGKAPLPSYLAQLPSRQMIEKTLKPLNLRLREDTVGRPRQA